MLADIGLAALSLSFLLGLYATVASAYGGLRQAAHRSLLLNQAQQLLPEQ
jgi:hypothetical protein